MNSKAVFNAAVSVLFLAGCEAAPGADKVLDPSGLKWNPDAIVYTESIRDTNWSSTETNPCNGETVAISGATHWVMHTSFDNLGGFHFKAQLVAKGTGVGSPNGTKYTINEHFKEAENTPGNYTSYVIREAFRLKVDGPTVADDYYKTTVHKITVNSAGVESMVVDSETNSCT